MTIQGLTNVITIQQPGENFCTSEFHADIELTVLQLTDGTDAVQPA